MKNTPRVSDSMARPEAPERSDSLGLVTVGLSALILAVFALAVLAGLSGVAEAAAERGWSCAARVDCGAPGLPTVQDLPTLVAPTVEAASASSAEAACLERHSSAYARLARNAGRSLSSDVFRAARSCEVAPTVIPRAQARASR